MRGDQGNYQRSNAMREIRFVPGAEACALAARVRAESAETGHRQVLAEALLDALCDAAAIDICHVRVSDAKQYHKTNGKRIVFRQYGYYKPATKYIYITNRTAARGQLLSAGAFLETLLHEWMHHYDQAQLGLRSIHSSGFYARLTSLKEALGMVSETI